MTVWLTPFIDVGLIKYKDLIIEGLQYHYYRQLAKSASEPTLLFLHGFPSTSEHWVNQVIYFSNKGYGVIALDMLGFGGTSKPVDPKKYDGCALAAHCIAILDAEGLEKVVVVSHDWGGRVGSRLANLYPERHLASIFLSISYIPPNPNLNIDDLIKSTKEAFGYDIYSYQKFLASDDAPSLIAAHEDSFYSIIFTSDPVEFKNHFGPEGEQKKWLLGDNIAPVASWAPEKNKHHEIFRAGGWMAPTNWYRSFVRGVLSEGDKAVPKDRYQLTHPVLHVTGLRDPVCRPEMARRVVGAFCSNGVIRDLDTGHWIMLERPDELNAIIDEYVAGL